MVDLNVSKELKRNIVNKNGFIELETEYVEGLEYAFYLTHFAGTEKTKYTEKSSSCFDVSFEEGRYTAIFYYKNNEKKTSYKVYFNINDKKEIELKELVIKNIAEKDGYKIDFYDIGASKTFIVFNGADSLKTTAPFALTYLNKRGFNVIACLQNNNQYQDLSFEDFEAYVSPLIVEKDVYLYGSSLGGYCALYYAGAVNGTVIASAPRNSAHPILVEPAQGESRFSKSDFKHSIFNSNKKTNRNIFIFFDPYVKNDVYFINTLIKTSFDNLTLINCDFAGHEVLYHLNHTKQLDGIIEAIVNNNTPIVRAVNSSYTYIGQAKQALSIGDYEKSVLLSEKALKDKTIKEPTRKKIKKFHSIAVAALSKSLS